MVEQQLRLRREAEVRRARARGKAWADGPLVARVLPNDLDPSQNRYAVIAGKKVGKAHERNRAKRLVREAIRHVHPMLRPGHDVVVIVRGDLAELPSLAAAQASLERIVRRAGLLGGGAKRRAGGANGPGGNAALPESAPVSVRSEGSND